jgi:hypothetical protein
MTTMSNELSRSSEAGPGALPNTFIVGAPKSGTTYLAKWLSLSPDVDSPVVKEPNFFDDPRQFSRGLGYYSATYYRNATGRPVAFDASPWYLYPEWLPQRLADAVGVANTRIVILLRDPVSRTVSQYFDQVGRLRERRTFEAVVDSELATADPTKVVATSSTRELVRHYALCGLYAEPVARYLDLFGDRVEVILAEELWRQTDQVAQRLESFLGIELPPPPDQVANPASRPRSAVVERLLHRFETSNSALREGGARTPAAFKAVIRSTVDVVSRLNQVPTTYERPAPKNLDRLAEWFQPANARLAEVLGRSAEWLS